MHHYAFRPVEPGDHAMLQEWLQRPHVAEVWDDRTALEEIAEDFAPKDGFGPHIALEDGVPAGYIQYYRVLATQDDGWWPDERDPDAYGIDQFLADGLGQGRGTAMIRAFVDHLFRELGASKVQTDPDPANGRAIRCYEKVGFVPYGLVDTPDGQELLMVVRREDWFEDQTVRASV
jgi:RimJ/RimL family protein N-acetyltransferase